MPLGNAHEQKRAQDRAAGPGLLTQQTATSAWPSQAQSIAWQGGGRPELANLATRATTNCRLATRSYSAH